VAGGQVDQMWANGRLGRPLASTELLPYDQTARSERFAVLRGIGCTNTETALKHLTNTLKDVTITKIFARFSKPAIMAVHDLK
jgi:hypothetical protein